MALKSLPNKFNKKKQDQIIKLIESGWFLKDIAKELEVSVVGIWQLRKRDAEFSRRYDDAFEVANAVHLDLAEAELYRRAVQGWAEPVYYKGRLVGPIRRFDGRLLTYWLRRLAPDRYKDRTDITSKDEAVPGLVVVGAPAKDEDEWLEQYGDVRTDDAEDGDS